MASTLLRVSRFAKWMPHLPQIYVPCLFTKEWGSKAKLPKIAAVTVKLMDSKYKVPLFLNATAKLEAYNRWREAFLVKTVRTTNNQTPLNANLKNIAFMPINKFCSINAIDSITNDRTHPMLPKGITYSKNEYAIPIRNLRWNARGSLTAAVCGITVLLKNVGDIQNPSSDLRVISVGTIEYRKRGSVPIISVTSKQFTVQKFFSRYTPFNAQTVGCLGEVKSISWP